MNNSFTTRVILVRHGRSTYNEQQRYQGCCDKSVLNQKGKKQAFEMGIALGSIKFDAVYVSPLQRTQETAREILRVNKYQTRLHLNSNLKEVDLPVWQGLHYKYVRQEFAEEYRIWEESPHEFTINSIEARGQTLIKTKTKPVLQLYNQAEKFWQEVLPRHQGKTILVVSHGGTIRALLGTAVGIEAKHYHDIQQSNGSINILNFDSYSYSRSGKVIAANITQHLGEVLPKLKNGKYGLRLLLLPVNYQNKQQPYISDKISLFLNKVKLDFCLSHHNSRSESIVESILKNHGNPPVNIEVAREDFLNIWHQTISRRSQSCETLSTGLVVADINTISMALNQILGLESPSSIQLNSGEISIIFYPVSRAKPVLQAMNIKGFGNW